MEPSDTDRLSVEKRGNVPPLGALAMVPLLVGAISTWWLLSDWLAQMTILWGGAVLCFLGGVRRGLGLRIPGGLHLGAIATALWLFLLGFGAIASPWPLAGAIALVVGFVSLGILDPPAARTGASRSVLARLRPLQMLVPAACMVAVATYFATAP